MHLIPRLLGHRRGAAGMMPSTRANRGFMDTQNGNVSGHLEQHAASFDLSHHSLRTPLHVDLARLGFYAA